MCLAGITAWSLSAAACVPVPPRYEEPIPSLGGRDSLAAAYDLGARDGNLSTRRPGGAIVALAFLGAVTAAAVLVRGVRGVMTFFLGLFGVDAGLTIWKVREAHQPAPVPPDSIRAFYGMASSSLWDSYVNGFQSAIAVRRQDAAAKSVIALIVMGAATAAILLILSAMQGLSSHVS